ADHLHELGYRASMAGAVVSAGTATTIAGALVAGRLAERWGLTKTLSAAALLLSAAMLCFGAIGSHAAIAYCGGVLLGLGWSVYYILAPVYLIQQVRSDARIKYL